MIPRPVEPSAGAVARARAVHYCHDAMRRPYWALILDRLAEIMNGGRR